eukprot:Phypoly_transcript_01050.p1 GENE.Phypoly_transcript_01050~~Phypoly_transcript_01050.p1  ORF type:complete len:906 (+),score=142.25 Phypoly_transcript_01050:476-3193(+)
MKGGVAASIVQDHGAVHQGTLESVVRKIFAFEKDIRGNARKDAFITNPVTGTVLELDIWLPKQRISFEFQDAYHYVTTWYSQSSIDLITYKDVLKREAVQHKGDTLVSVPCWWDGTEASLAETVRFQRPDLDLPKTLELPIPLNPPRSFFLRGGVPDVGELMNASFPADGKLVDYVSAGNSWWMGEKYDGVRICWNADRQIIYTRAGLTLALPTSFISLFPDIFLDGEFWFGRGYFPDAQRIVKSELNVVAWHFLRVTAFDVPSLDVQHFPFEDRYAFLVDYIPVEHPFILFASRVMCNNRRHLKRTLKSIIRDGGEGVILRRPKSMYEHGRTPNLMKLKASRGDREGIVVSVDERKAVTLKLPDGVTFVVSAQNVKPGLRPKIGDIVTFSYEDFSRKASPVNPNIYRIRTDVSWKDVVRNFDEETAFSKQMEEAKFTAKRYGFWSAERGKNVRQYLKKFAKRRGLDPLLPDTWYSLSWRDLGSAAGGKSIARHMKGGIVNTLVNLFPDIGLEVSKFRVIRKSWESVKDRRKWFDRFAKLHKFDPLKPSNWYKMKLDTIFAIKGGKNILEYYSRSLAKALIHAYPEIGFDQNKFPVVYKFYWQSKENRRKFFIDFAAGNDFDPLVAANWYSRSFREFIAWKGASRVLSYYDASYTKALLDLFPDIGLDVSKFESKYWRSSVARREWFESFAAKWEVDPTVPEDWYRVAPFIKQAEGSQSVLKVYGGSVFKALSSLFPNIELLEEHFHRESQWEDARRRKKFLERVAASKKIQPKKASNWYSISRQDFVHYKEGFSFLKYFSGNIPNAISDSFPNIGLDPSQFQSPDLLDPRNFWNVEKNRRKFFEDFAANNNFDPLLPENWYSIAKRQLLVQGGNRVLLASDGSVAKALKKAFPEIKFSEHKFTG